MKKGCHEVNLQDCTYNTKNLTYRSQTYTYVISSGGTDSDPPLITKVIWRTTIAKSNREISPLLLQNASTHKVIACNFNAIRTCSGLNSTTNYSLMHGILPIAATSIVHRGQIIHYNDLVNVDNLNC